MQKLGALGGQLSGLGLGPALGDGPQVLEKQGMKPIIFLVVLAIMVLPLVFGFTEKIEKKLLIFIPVRLSVSLLEVLD